VFFIRKGSLLLILITCIFAGLVFAHTPLLLVEDNGDGTLYAEAGFSDGSGAKDLGCRLEDESGNVLFDGKFDDFNSIEIEIPDVYPYFVVFDAGPGHIVKKEGPAKSGASDPETVEPKEKETDVSVNNSEKVVNTVPQVQNQNAMVSQPVQSVNWLPQSTYFGNSNNGSSGSNEIMNTVLLAIVTVLLAVIAISLLIIAVVLVNRKN